MISMGSYRIGLDAPISNPNLPWRHQTTGFEMTTFKYRPNVSNKAKTISRAQNINKLAALGLFVIVKYRKLNRQIGDRTSIHSNTNSFSVVERLKGSSQTYPFPFFCDRVYQKQKGGLKVVHNLLRSYGSDSFRGIRISGVGSCANRNPHIASH